MARPTAAANQPKYSLPQTNRYKLKGFLRLMSPLHIAGHQKQTFSTTDGMISNSQDGIPITSVQKLALAPTGSSWLTQTPVIAANNIMGRLRRHAAALLINQLERTNQKIAITTFQGIQCGALSGKPGNKEINFDEYRETRVHPYLGLFGGGPSMLRRHVQLENLVPYTEESSFMLEHDPHPRLSEIQKMLNAGLTRGLSFRRLDGLRDLKHLDQVAAVVEEWEDALDDYHAKLSVDMANKKKTKTPETEAGTFVSTNVFAAIEYVPPGVIFPISFTLDATNAQVGLFLSVLDRFAAQERLGGLPRIGFGAFALNDMTLINNDGNELASSHDPIFNNSRLNRECAAIRPFLDEWTQEEAQLSGPDLDRLLAPPVDPKAKKTTEEAAA